MAAGLKGAFTVTVHRAEQLKDTATFGKQDPFCKVTIGSNTQKTKVHKDGGTAPVWEQAFTFNLEGKEDLLHIACAEDGALSDSDIGRADIALTTLLQHAGRKKYPLADRNNFKINAGYIELTCEFKGTGAPQVLSKSAEVLAQEKHQAAIQAGAQAAEIEKMRLEVEKMRLEAQAEAARAAQAAAMVRQMQTAAQPVYVPPVQPTVVGQTVQVQAQVQPQVVQKVEVKQEVKGGSGAIQIVGASVVLYEGNWRYCQKCQCLYKGTNGKNTPPCPASGVHDGDSDQTSNYQFSCGATKPAAQCQEGWILCDKCTCMCYSNAGKCIKGGPHNSNGQKYYAHLTAHTPHHQDQWNFCKKCYQLVYGPKAAGSACAAGGNHDNAGSWNYVVAHGAEVKQVAACAYQGNWRYCQKCQLLYYGPSGTHTPACAAGGVHDGHADQTSNYHIGFGDPKPSELHQEGWTFCQKCWCMCYGSNGACVRGGPHDTSTSWKYVMHRVPHFTASQKGWHFCKKCYSLCWGEKAKGSACAAGGNHDDTGSWEYVVAYK